MGGTPIEVVVSQGSCGGGVCRGSVSLASGERGLEEGTTYIVSVSASNRYGQSSESGNSNPFTFGAGPTSSGEGFVLLRECGVCVCVASLVCVSVLSFTNLADIT